MTWSSPVLVGLMVLAQRNPAAARIPERGHNTSSRDCRYCFALPLLAEPASALLTASGTSTSGFSTHMTKYGCLACRWLSPYGTIEVKGTELSPRQMRMGVIDANLRRRR
jgi:hypothetical protein